MTLSPRRAAAVVAAGALAAVLSACSGSGSGAPARGSGSSGGSNAPGTTRIVEVTVTAARGCTAAQSSYPAGPLTFRVKNTDATAVSEIELLSGERIVGEKENVPPGFSGQFSVKVDGGAYQLYCPGATPERTPLAVTGKAADSTDATLAALLRQAGTGYAQYVDTQVAQLVIQVGRFTRTLHGTNLQAARTAYMRARPYYERIEPVAESFVLGKDVLDADIDIRIADVPSFAEWRGFHRIEYSLFKQHTLKGMGAFGDKLVADVARLRTLTLALRTYAPTELANGAQSLMEEVARNKISGEEERYSGIDLLDFANNDEGSEQAFAQLQPALQKIDPSLSRTVAARFAALDRLVATYRTNANASGYELYPSLTTADKRQLSAAVAAVSAPLSTLGSKVANA